MVSFLDARFVSVAQPIIDLQFFGAPPVILSEQSVGPIVDLPPGIANLNGRLEWIAGKKIFQRCRAVSRSYGHAAQECDAASSVAKRAATHAVTMQFAAELEGMRSHGVGSMVDELRDRVRSLEFRPLKSAQAGNECSSESAAEPPAR